MKFTTKIFSQNLLTSTWISVVTPNSINNSPKKVVYLLHGMYGDNESWIDNTPLQSYADEYGIIFIMPEAHNSFYNDTAYGKHYYQYIAYELPELSKSIFNISHKPKDTSIMGLSMGGYGALKIALNNPSNYSLCCSFSGATFTKEALTSTIMHEDEHKHKLFKSIFGESVNIPDVADIFKLAINSSKNESKPIIYQTCGTEDFLIEYNHAYRDLMNTLDFDYTYEQWAGEHVWDFWAVSLKKTLEKYYKKISE